MTGWMEAVQGAALRYARAVVREALSEVTASDVAGAKAQMTANIQAQKKVPGTVRRWLCRDVENIRAGDMRQFREQAEALMRRLS